MITFPILAFHDAVPVGIEFTRRLYQPALTCTIQRPWIARIRSNSGDSAQKQDQNANGHERQRRASQELCYAIKTLAAPRLHESDQGEYKSQAVTDQGDGNRSLGRPPRAGGIKGTSEKTKPKKEKRRESKFAQMIHATICLTDVLIPRNRPEFRDSD